MRIETVINAPRDLGCNARLPNLVMALAGALANTLCAVTGITNKSLRALITGLLGATYSMNQASYDLARLARNGLLTRILHRNLYALTPDGLRFAICYTKVHDRVLRPPMASDQPQAPRGCPPSARPCAPWTAKFPTGSPQHAYPPPPDQPAPTLEPKPAPNSRSLSEF